MSDLRDIQKKLGQITEMINKMNSSKQSFLQFEDSGGYESNMKFLVFSPSKNKVVKHLLDDVSSYQLKSEKNVSGGYAGLDNNKLLSLSQIPNIGISKVSDLQTQLNSKLGVNADAQNSLKLGGELPSFYAPQSTTYNKTEVDNNIITAVNNAVAQLLNNPDADINSISELNNLIQNNLSVLSTKVSYTQNQSLTTAQKLIAKTNIGLENAALKNIDNAFSVSQTLNGNLSITGEVKLDNNKGLLSKDSSGAYRDLFKLDDSNDILIGSTALSGKTKFLSTGEYFFEGSAGLVIKRLGVNSFITFQPGSSVKTGSITLGSSGSKIKSTSDSNLVFYTNGHDRYVISDSGQHNLFGVLISDGSITAPNFIGNWNGKVISDFDKYEYFNLKVDGVQKKTIQSKNNLNFIPGPGIDLAYSADGGVNISTKVTDGLFEIKGSKSGGYGQLSGIKLISENTTNSSTTTSRITSFNVDADNSELIFQVEKAGSLFTSMQVSGTRITSNVPFAKVEVESTIANIDSGASKILVTKEWVEDKFHSKQTGSTGSIVVGSTSFNFTNGLYTGSTAV